MGDLSGATRAGSELAKLRGEAVAGPLPALDEEAVRATHAAVRELVRSGTVRGAHDIAEGGIAVAIAECCIAGGLGATIALPEGVEPFAEALGRAFIVSGPEDALLGQRVIGRVGGPTLALEGVLEIDVSRLAAARSEGLVRFM